MHVKISKILATHDSEGVKPSKNCGQRKVDCNRLTSELTVKKYR